MKKLVFIISLMMSFSVSNAQNKAEKICGVYLVVEQNEVSKVKISRKSDGTFSGQVIWAKNPNFEDGTPKTDINNPDPSKRNTPTSKIVLLYDFKYDEGDDEWSGDIYNPVDGKTYKAYAKFESEKNLKLRGYVGLPIFGRTVYWQKLE
ncbi:MAG: DUF2147 domain-containing protein [Bacteroidales bacterium]|nr:DUF2147 domain-containing protein [Bacteroidales bacterium]